ncbi:MAG: hypothetical protein F6K11_34450 [Leptolyngbya sp. SIO3F4]|nr:hypothetical protein [Leptolyngbya sp. SIO3F4]
MGSKAYTETAMTTGNRNTSTNAAKTGLTQGSNELWTELTPEEGSQISGGAPELTHVREQPEGDHLVLKPSEIYQAPNFYLSKAKQSHTAIRRVHLNRSPVF